MTGINIAVIIIISICIGFVIGVWSAYKVKEMDTEEEEN